MADIPMIQYGEETLARLLLCLQENPRNESAWNELVCYCRPMLQRWCRSWHLQPSDAADLTQSVLLALARRMPRFRYDPSKSFRAYLKTLARYARCDLLQCQRKHEASCSDLDSGHDLASVVAREEIQYEETREWELLAVAMNQVSRLVEPHTWEAFKLQVFQEMSGQEVAVRLTVSVATAYKAKSNIVKMLKRTVQTLTDK